MLWIYVLVYALYLLEFPRQHFGAYTVAYSLQAGRTFAEALLIPIAAISLYHRNLKLPATIFVLYTLTCVWMGWDGLMVAPSFNTATCALLLTFVSPWVAALTILTAVTHHGTTALVVIGIHALVYAIRGRFRWWVLAPVPVLLLAVAQYHANSPLLDGSERIQQWIKYMTFWATGDWKQTIFGFGPGSFLWTGMILDEFKGSLFLCMHNDWLQILWELGIVGIVLAVWVVQCVISNAAKFPRDLAAVLSCCVFACFYHPVRFFPSALIVCIIFLRAGLRKQDA
jgi:hypothetical protein